MVGFDFVASEQEIDLVVGLGHDSKTVTEIAEMMNMTIEEAEHRTATRLYQNTAKYVLPIENQLGKIHYLHVGVPLLDFLFAS